MKKTVLLAFSVSAFILTSFQPANPPGVKWDQQYSFNKCNAFRIEIYAKNNELMATKELKTYYQSDGKNFDVKFISNRAGSGMETVMDINNQVAIQILGGGGGATPIYNAGGFRYPDAADLKRLDIIPTDETKKILGYTCKKYTYTYKKIFGEVWITDQVNLANDLGVFRAAKMAALHNTLSVPGFVMEMTTEDIKGGRTLMTTISLESAEKYTVNFTGVEMSSAMNKVNYYTF